MFKYCINIENDLLEVEKKMFDDFIFNLSKTFIICKFDNNFNPSCESELKSDDSLFYYIVDPDSKNATFIGEVYKI